MCGEVMTVLPTRQATVGVGTPAAAMLNGTEADPAPPTVMLLGQFIVGEEFDTQVLSSTDKVFIALFAVAKSGLPSRLKSPTATEAGLNPTSIGDPIGCVKFAFPSFNNMVTPRSKIPARAILDTMRSGLPSKLKSPTARDPVRDPTPTGEPNDWENPPAPFPSKTVTLLDNLL
ncbi:MAG: hypothetical protein AAB401_06630, partial [Acidobacteriota bacterium]